MRLMILLNSKMLFIVVSSHPLDWIGSEFHVEVCLEASGCQGFFPAH
jgi:hypothetical protein